MVRDHRRRERHLVGVGIHVGFGRSDGSVRDPQGRGIAECGKQQEVNLCRAKPPKLF